MELTPNQAQLIKSHMEEGSNGAYITEGTLARLTPDLMAGQGFTQSAAYRGEGVETIVDWDDGVKKEVSAKVYFFSPDELDRLTPGRAGWADFASTRQDRKPNNFSIAPEGKGFRR